MPLPASRMILLYVLVAFVPISLAAQPRLHFEAVATHGTEVELTFTVICEGKGSYDMKKEHFRVVEDGLELTQFELEVNDPRIRCAVSLALVFDFRNQYPYYVRAIGRSLVAMMDGVIDEAAIVGTDDPWIVHGMSMRKDSLLAAVDALSEAGDKAIWDAAYAGVNEVATHGMNQCRSVILITDGKDTVSERSAWDVRSLANHHRIHLVIIGVGEDLDAEMLEEIATLTGGQYVQNPDEEALQQLYKELSTTEWPVCFPPPHSIRYTRLCMDGATRNVELHLTDYCSGSDVQVRSYQAASDSSTFLPLPIAVGAVTAVAGTRIGVPLHAVHSGGDGILHPCTLHVRYDTTLLDFVELRTPQGAILEGIPMLVTRQDSGLLIESRGTAHFSGSAVLLELLLRTAKVSDTAHCLVAVSEMSIGAGCLLPETEDAIVTITPPAVFPISITAHGPTRFCDGASVVLDAGAGYQTYEWSSGASTRRLTVMHSGAYFCTVRDQDGNTGLSDTIHVLVHPVAKPAIHRSGDTLRTLPDGVSYHWYLDGLELAGDSGPAILLARTGVYTVSVTDSNGCSGESDPFVVTVLGGLQVFAARELSLKAWPDPAYDVLDIGLRGSVGEQVRIVLTDVLGKSDIVYSGRAGEAGVALRISLQGRARGPLFIHAQVGDRRITRKVMRY
jgi:hypothetical protein